MTIRHAFGADIPRLVAWGRKFHTAGGIKAKYDDAATAAFLSSIIQNDDAAVLLSDHGMIGGILVPAYCDPSWKIAVEMFWWADKGGRDLLAAFEEWASSMGASEIRMTSLASLPRASKLLSCLGYEATEVSYQKVI